MDSDCTGSKTGISTSANGRKAYFKEMEICTCTLKATRTRAISEKADSMDGATRFA